MKRFTTRPLCSAMAALLLGSVGATAYAADSVTTLRIADSLPNGSYIYKLVTQPFMEQVEKETNGKIKFQYFPGQQLGKAKDMLKLTQTGMADIGYIGPSYILDKMPLSSTFELPGAFSDDSCQGFKAFWNMTVGSCRNTSGILMVSFLCCRSLRVTMSMCPMGKRLKQCKTFKV
ncbi:hypothetical protein [Pusillimonas sp. ANT_WB101]|uniref:hypothetical protein n=1 Tax=Pusillimonas sp. ANT_WB101 TaxID=2597356 RepID=UPI0011EFEF75|nr:hypothetical protein [Pusillimonas sp. ANT_WB101]KAA0890865.1 hypothetical protein FQ179_14515 [Pusillimonas sp. ANT_WB101]